MSDAPMRGVGRHRQRSTRPSRRHRLGARVASTMIAAGALAAAPVGAADAAASHTRAFAGRNVPLEVVRPVPDGSGEYHVVAAGEHLSAVAAAHGLEGEDAWRRLFDANPNIADPNLLEPGDRVRIPAPDERFERRELPQVYVAPAVARGGGRAASGAGVWDRLAGCESGGNWAANTGNGYFGGLQFSLRSWQAVGGSGYPHEHPRATQIAMAERLRATQGWGAWPGCSRKLGLR